VLVHGLGLGCLIRPVLLVPEVAELLVVELDQQVIDLVAPHYLAAGDPRLRIVQGDAYTWRPRRGERWAVAWHDIWDDICADNYEGMVRLHRRFARRTDWQGSWSKALTLRQLRRGW
jgi:spermidine synthase